MRCESRCDNKDATHQDDTMSTLGGHGQIDVRRYKKQQRILYEMFREHGFISAAAIYDLEDTYSP